MSIFSSVFNPFYMPSHGRLNVFNMALVNEYNIWLDGDCSMLLKVGDKIIIIGGIFVLMSCFHYESENSGLTRLDIEKISDHE